MENYKNLYAFDNLSKEAENVLTQIVKGELTLKSNTTLIALKYKEGIVFASDLQSTLGMDNKDKFVNRSKTIVINSSVVFEGSGAVSIIDFIARRLRRYAVIYERETYESCDINTASRYLRSILVKSPTNMFGGILSGYSNLTKSYEIYEIWNDGCLSSKQYSATMGSCMIYSRGSLHPNDLSSLDKDDAEKYYKSNKIIDRSRCNVWFRV